MQQSRSSSTKRRNFKPVVTTHPNNPTQYILSYGTVLCSGFECLDYQYYDNVLNKTTHGGKHRYLCLEREDNVFCDEDKRYGKGMNMIHPCKVRSYRALKEGLQHSVQKHEKELHISDILIRRICQVIAETRLAFLAAESESIRNLIISSIEIGQHMKDTPVDLLMP
ncbi:MAG: hypothetical protein EZS28_008045 [Streblomastix strix]|uniref:Uncharacterized protein n=1 Tax=Streblomastix strix TaxID=222440 RepID=A0A5J4WNN9_9EUKA|nr:MAG: hypothetical protein EZS28_008045 [Streblomastix strix]